MGPVVISIQSFSVCSYFLAINVLRVLNLLSAGSYGGMSDGLSREDPVLSMAIEEVRNKMGYSELKETITSFVHGRDTFTGYVKSVSCSMPWCLTI